MVGVVSYGFYIPKYRIKISDIAKIWGKNPDDIFNSLKVSEKSVSGIDEDSLTMAHDASQMAFSDVKIKKNEVGVVFVGSETHPYAVNPTSTILAEFLEIENHYLAFDTQFACKAATGAAIAALGLIKSGFAKYALVCASDKSTGSPHDALEYTAASGSVSLILGKEDMVLEIVDYTSFSSDTPDFWRREGIRYPSHSGRFTGKPSYFYHIEQASKELLKKTKLKAADFKYAVFHMPNGKFPVQVGYSLGFEKKQFEKSLVVSYLGNSYSASALMGLVSVLESAKENDLIFFASYGSGAGSDAFVFKVTKNLKNRRREFTQAISQRKYIDYPTYLKFMKAI